MTYVMRYLSKMSGRSPLPATPKFSVAVISGMGASFAIALVASLAELSESALLMAPLGASCFLAFAVPESPLAQPRNIVLGHVVSTLVGLLVLSFVGSDWWAMALAVGLSVALMQLSRCSHAPAGANPLLVLLTEPSWSFLIFPVLAGSALIALVAVIFNNLRPSLQYPKYW
jgi:CBS-domain-containing membrane protein